MRLTQFGKVVRQLRMEHDISLKDMAVAMHMGSSYLSALEYGERKLSDDHVEKAVAFLSGYATAEELSELRKAAAGSSEVISTSGVNPDSRHMVAAFARRLQEGLEPPAEVLDWLRTQH